LVEVNISGSLSHQHLSLPVCDCFSPRKNLPVTGQLATVASSCQDHIRGDITSNQHIKIHVCGTVSTCQ